jgi:hypothetical protein
MTPGGIGFNRDMFLNIPFSSPISQSYNINGKSSLTITDAMPTNAVAIVTTNQAMNV